MFYYDLTFSYYSFLAPPPFNQREGFLLSWKNKKGQLCQSDIFPLPGYSQETLHDIKEQLEALQKAPLAEEELFPSVHFALYHPLTPTSRILPQRYQALIQTPPDEAKIPLFKTLKLKTAHFSAHKLIDMIKKLSSTHTLRLDAQRGFLDPKLLELLLDNPSLYEYVEEPNLEQKDAAYLKIALDETLYQEKTIPPLTNLKALVYKPTLCGGLRALKNLPDLPIILSSAYESSLGLKRIILLHQTLHPNASWDIGLDTFPLHEKKPFLHCQAPTLYELYP